MDKIDKLFDKGLDAFNNKRFYEAHEFWENIWVEYRLPDSKFIQGLIQLTVGFYHITNQNLNGARSLLRKSKKKFDLYDGTHRRLSMIIIKRIVNESLDCAENINSVEEFDWSVCNLLEKQIDQ